MSEHITQNEATVGTITRGDRVYEIDWPATLDTADLPRHLWEREDYAVIYLDGSLLQDFINPDWELDGWLTVELLMEDAERVVDYIETERR